MENESQATADQYNRMAGYEDVKGKVRQEVNEEIAGQAGRLDEHERVQAAAVCGRLKPNAAREVIDTEAELEGRDESLVSCRLLIICSASAMA